jgi:hypothetical protein
MLDTSRGLSFDVPMASYTDVFSATETEIAAQKAKRRLYLQM